MVLFFYDGPVSQGIAFENLLQKGESFADRLTGIFSNQQEAQLINIATDGETYGHHHKKGNMALAYCLNYIEAQKLAKVTIYGEYLEKYPPNYEVEIFENSSWSCIHGIERWKSNCGCSSGMHSGWSQEWRAPLRGALDWLRDNLAHVYEKEVSSLVKDAWDLRNDYINIVLDRSEGKIEQFMCKHSSRVLTKDEKIKVIKLLEAQRHAMLMYTSCGWFFDEISGLETVQILQYASRAIQLSSDVSQITFEETFIDILERIPSNIPEYKNGAYIYRKFVKPALVDLVRVGAHHAMASLFKEHFENTRIYSYSVKDDLHDILKIGKQRLSFGKSTVASNITLDEKIISFVVLHLGDHNIIGGAREFNDEQAFINTQEEIKKIFKRSDIPGTIGLIEKYFTANKYSLWHLFRDEQTEIINDILDSTFKDIVDSLRKINERHYPVIQAVKQLNVPFPKMLSNTVLMPLNNDLVRIFESEQTDLRRLEQIVSEVKEWALEIDCVMLEFAVRKRINDLMERFFSGTQRMSLLKETKEILRILKPLNLDINLWRVQNIYFLTAKKYFQEKKSSAVAGDVEAKNWIDVYKDLGTYINMKGI